MEGSVAAGDGPFITSPQNPGIDHRAPPDRHARHWPEAHTGEKEKNPHFLKARHFTSAFIQGFVTPESHVTAGTVRHEFTLATSLATPSPRTRTAFGTPMSEIKAEVTERSFVPGGRRRHRKPKESGIGSRRALVLAVTVPVASAALAGTSAFAADQNTAATATDQPDSLDPSDQQMAANLDTPRSRQAAGQ
jgi:hypothetical protein